MVVLDLTIKNLKHLELIETTLIFLIFKFSGLVILAINNLSPESIL